MDDGPPPAGSRERWTERAPTSESETTVRLQPMLRQGARSTNRDDDLGRIAWQPLGGWIGVGKVRL